MNKDHNGTAAPPRVAVVGLGLVVPGACSPEEYWALHERGVPIFSEPEGRWNRAGYFSADPRSEDRSYAAKLGFIHDSIGGPAANGQPGATDLTARWLHASLRQSLTAVTRRDTDRWSFVVGYTVDGNHQLLESLVLANGITAGGRLEELCRKQLPYAGDRPEFHLPHVVVWEAMAGLLPDTTDLLIVDTACSSSLYAVDIAARRVASGLCDIAVCGGVFALGWRDLILFAKFGVLSKSDDVRSMDRGADGVLFSDGAAALVLKDLARARADGDHIFGILAGTGVSCDGKGAAINAPRAEGQRLALECAWSAAGVSGSEIDLIVAHATGTPQGDRMELRVLGEKLAGRQGVTVVSPKSIVGHTGWAAGAVSLIHALLILEHGIIPPQHRFSAFPDGLNFATSTLDVPTTARRLPRRHGKSRVIGVSAFGFGGTNAHVVVTDEVPTPSVLPAAANVNFSCVLVDWDSYLPGQPTKKDVEAWWNGERPAPPATFGAEFPLPTFAELRMPAAAIAVTDASQLMALRATAKLKQRLREGVWERRRDCIGVFAGHQGPTKNGILYALRCSLGLLAEGITGMENEEELSSLFTAHADRVRSAIPAGSTDSYTGLMPNLVPARVANVLDAHGLNLLVDTGRDSALNAVRLAAEYLNSGSLEMAVVLGINANSLSEWRRIVCRTEALGDCEIAEGAFALLLARGDVAKQEGLPVIAAFESGKGHEKNLDEMTVPGRSYLAGDSAVAVLRAALGSEPIGIKFRDRATGRRNALHVQPRRSRSSLSVSRQVVRLTDEPPIRVREPLLEIPEDCLILTNVQGRLWDRQLPPGCLILSTRPGPSGAELITEPDENSITAAVTTAGIHAGHVRLITDTSGSLASLSALTDLALSAVKAINRSADRSWSFAALLLNAFDGETPRPETGMFTGFVKSLASEFPEHAILAVVTSEVDPVTGLRLLISETANQQMSPVVFINRGRRCRQVIEPDETHFADQLTLDRSSVVVAAGGGRGITASLLIAIAARVGPKIWVLGSNDISDCPDWVFEMDDAAFADARAAFIRKRLQSSTGSAVAEHSREFDRYKHIRETRTVLRQLAELCGPDRVRYLCCDVTNRQMTAQAARAILSEDATVDLFLFAAGVISAAAVERKSLAEFRRVRDTKVLGYRYLKEAFAGSPPKSWCNFGSILSLVWGEGMIDYCCANDFLAAAAVHARQTKGSDEWTVSWPLWRETGMATDLGMSSYISREHGQIELPTDEGIDLMLGELSRLKHDPHITFMGATEITAFQHRRFWFSEPPPATNHPPRQVTSNAADRSFGKKVTETEFPLLGRVDERSPGRLVAVTTRNDGIDEILRHHLIRERPAMPGMLALEIAAEAARMLGFDLRPMAFENVTFLQPLYIRSGDDRPIFRTEAEVIEDDISGPRIRVRISSDFWTPKGVPLAKNVLHYVLDVVGSNDLRQPEHTQFDSNGRITMADPYYSPNSSVWISGPFHNTRHLRSGHDGAQADFVLPALSPQPWSSFSLPVLLLDAAARVGLVGGAKGEPVVPAVLSSCRRITLTAPGNDLALAAALPQGIRLYGNAIEETPKDAGTGGVVQCLAVTSTGQTLAVIDRLQYSPVQARSSASTTGTKESLSTVVRSEQQRQEDRRLITLIVVAVGRRQSFRRAISAALTMLTRNSYRTLHGIDPEFTSAASSLNLTDLTQKNIVDCARQYLDRALPKADIYIAFADTLEAAPATVTHAQAGTTERETGSAQLFLIVDWDKTYEPFPDPFEGMLTKAVAALPRNIEAKVSLYHCRVYADTDLRDVYYYPKYNLRQAPTDSSALAVDVVSAFTDFVEACVVPAVGSGRTGNRSNHITLATALHAFLTARAGASWGLHSYTGSVVSTLIADLERLAHASGNPVLRAPSEHGLACAAMARWLLKKAPFLVVVTSGMVDEFKGTLANLRYAQARGFLVCADASSDRWFPFQGTIHADEDARTVMKARQLHTIYLNRPEHLIADLQDAFAAYDQGQGPVVLIATPAVLETADSPGLDKLILPVPPERRVEVTGGQADAVLRIINSDAERLLWQCGDLTGEESELVHDLARRCGAALCDSLFRPGTVGKYRSGVVAPEYLGTLGVYGTSASVYNYLHRDGKLRAPEQSHLFFLKSRLAEICTPFTERTLATRLRLVQVTREKTHLAPFTHYPVCSELIDFLRHLSGAVKVSAPILERRRRALAESRPTSMDLLGEGVSQPMSPNYFFHHLNRIIEDLITRQNYSYIGVFDVGRGGISAVRNLARVRPGFSGWYGRALMGDALMAVPAIAVTENDNVLAFIGDGAAALVPDILPTLIQQICLEGSGFHHNLSIFRLLNGGQSLIRTYREVRRSAPAELQTTLVSLVPEEWSRSFGSLTVRHRRLIKVDGDELGKQLLDKSTINLYSVALSHNNDGDGIGLHTFLSWQQATLSSPQTWGGR